MNILPVTVFLAVLSNTLTDSNAYLSEAAIKRTQQMLKSVCSMKHKVDEETLANIKKGIFPEENENLKCYFACTFKTMQLVNAKGVVEKKMFKDKMIMLLPPSLLETLLPSIEECGGKDNGPLCDTSYDFIKCSYAVNPISLDMLPV